MKKQKTNSLSQKAIDLLREAAKDKNTWMDAMRDPLAFLSKNGEILPKGTDLRLYQNDWDPKNLSFHESELDTRLPAPSVPVGGGTGGRPSCPAGQMPYKTIQRTRVCLKKVVYRGQIAWDPVSKHFGYPNSMEVCLLWLETEAWVWVCGTPIPLPDQERVLRPS